MKNRIPVDGSSNVQAVGYDPIKQEMFIEFKGGNTYKYSDVPQKEYDALLASKSKGKYIVSIKGKYASEKMGDEK